jgi:hypothetical protein
MIRRWIWVSVALAAAVCAAESSQPNKLKVNAPPATTSQGGAKSGPLTAAEYRDELEQLLTATEQLNSSGSSLPEALKSLPRSWNVRNDQAGSDQNSFEISTEGLQEEVRRYEKESSAENALAIRRRVQSLRDAIDGYEKPAADSSANRAALNAILARPEFRNVSGPNWWDRLKQWLMEWVIRLLRHVFRAVAIPTISRIFVYGLMGLAFLALVYVAYRSFWRDQEFAGVVPKDLPVSAKEWTIWLAEARAAAARGEWRDAIHLAYWAGISFLERQGFWKPDRARTPREYLRLLAGASEQRETLTALTRTFELAWYAKRDADEAAFAQTLAQLEKLGCR